MLSKRTPVDFNSLTIEQVVQRMTPGHKDALVVIAAGSLPWDQVHARIRDSLTHKGLVSPFGEVTKRGHAAALKINVDRAAAWEGKYQ